MPNLIEWVMMISTIGFWPAYPLRTVFLYWVAVGISLGIKYFFKI